MSISPLRASSGAPFTSMRMVSVLMSADSAVSCSHPGAAVRHAHVMSDVILELVAEVLDEALHGPGGCVAEGADRVAFDLVRDVHQHVELLLASLAALDAADHAIHPAGSFATRRALSARLRIVEAGDALQHAYHAGRLVHDDDRARAERRSGGAHGVVVHVDRHDLRGGQ